MTHFPVDEDKKDEKKERQSKCHHENNKKIDNISIAMCLQP